MELGVTPSALSHALRAIEERLDLRLVNRTTRSVALTEAGERLFARRSPAFRDIEDALEDLNTFRGKPAGMLRLNSARQSARLVLLPIITKFLKAYPDVRIDLVIDDALVDVVSGRLRCGRAFRRNYRRRHDRGADRAAPSLCSGWIARFLQETSAAGNTA